MLLLCLVPFSNAQQMNKTLAPYIPLPASLANDAPTPISEEDDERESADGKERIPSQSRDRLPARQHRSLLPLVHFTHHSLPHSPLAAPFDADPFHNGLGSHYRC
jgi:hypothetical protein